MIIRSFLDYTSLGLTTFFLAEPYSLPIKSSDGELSRSRPALLWLYFTTREIRSVLYAGFASRIILDLCGKSSFFGEINPLLTSHRWLGWCTVALLASASVLTWIPNLFSSGKVGQDPEDRGKWWFSAWDAEAPGLLGVWWLGAGNGEWFLFGGHNDPNSNSILPSAFLDQMSSRKSENVDTNDQSDEVRIVELDESPDSNAPTE